MSSKAASMRCPVGASVTRMSPVPVKIQPLPAGAAPDQGPVPPRTYKVEDERVYVQEKKVNGRTVKENVKVVRCKENLRDVKRIDANNLMGTCPKHGTFPMNAAIWGKEAGL